MVRYSKIFIHIFIFTFLINNLCSGKDITVCSVCGYKTNNIVVDKRVQILGEDNPVIDLEFINQGFIVRKDSVIIRGLEIRNIKVSYVQDLSAIKIENSSGCTVENNTLYNTFFALYLANSDNCLVRGNKITGFAQTESSSGNGIHLWKCNNIRIESNETSGHRDGNKHTNIK